jgi:subtilisin-like proprotein convertase family protein
MLRVQVSHAKSGEVGIELTSPGGTKSILMNINNSFLLDNDSNLNLTLSSHAFYGETLNGNWTIRLIDGRSGSSGTLTRWKMNIFGH